MHGEDIVCREGHIVEVKVGRVYACSAMAVDDVGEVP